MVVRRGGTGSHRQSIRTPLRRKIKFKQGRHALSGRLPAFVLIGDYQENGSPLLITTDTTPEYVLSVNVPTNASVTSVETVLPAAQGGGTQPTTLIPGQGYRPNVPLLGSPEGITYLVRVNGAREGVPFIEEYPIRIITPMTYGDNYGENYG